MLINHSKMFPGLAALNSKTWSVILTILNQLTGKSIGNIIRVKT